MKFATETLRDLDCAQPVVSMLQRAYDMLRAARDGDVEQVRCLLLSHNVPPLVRDIHGNNAIMLATIRGHLPIIQTLWKCLSKPYTHLMAPCKCLQRLLPPDVIARIGLLLVDQRMVAMTNDAGKNIMDLAGESSLPEVVAFFQDPFQLFRPSNG